MEIRSAEFVMSNTTVKGCPKPTRPEYAFIGRSNVGKSSLLNMLSGRKKLAKISSTPGKTRLINHFLVNDEWYIVDLPGYGYAKISKTERQKWRKMVHQYLRMRSNLMCVFVLIDSRIPPQKIDLEFMDWLGSHQIPFVIVFTKADKLKKSELDNPKSELEKAMLTSWESLPQLFYSSGRDSTGKEELLSFIEETNALFDY